MTKLLRGAALVLCVFLAISAYSWVEHYRVTEKRHGRGDSAREVELLVFSDPRRKADITWAIGAEGDTGDYAVGVWKIKRIVPTGTVAHLDAHVVGDVGDDEERELRCEGYVNQIRVSQDKHRDKCAINFEVLA